MSSRTTNLDKSVRRSLAVSSPKQWRLSAANLDWPLLLIVAALALFGLVMVTSASLSIAERNFGDAFFYTKRQMLFALVSVLLAWVVFHIKIDSWSRCSGAMLLLAIGLLILVLIPGIGKTVNGASRWLDLGLVNFQVSELVKFLTIIYIAGYLVRRGDEVRTTLFGFVKPIAVLCVVAVLLMLEPDFGATVVVMATAMGVMFLGGVRFGQFFLLIAMFVGSVVLLAISSPYRMERITSFLNPWADPYGSGFQLTQSLIAIGSGAWFGLGLGGSVQKLFYLPEAHTDFLFAVIAEEVGLLGSTIIILLYGALIARIFVIADRARRAGHAFATYVAYGLGLWLAMQTFINIGVNMGVLPTKGLTLPLMSYGGSSLLMTATVIALLLRIGHEAALAETQASPRSRRSRPAEEAA